jgi:hypothetical protein
MSENNKIFGELFGTIPLITENHIDVLLTTMDREKAIYYLVEAVKSAHSRGSFAIGEVEVISKAIRVLSKTIE